MLPVISTQDVDDSLLNPFAHNLHSSPSLSGSHEIQFSVAQAVPGQLESPESPSHRSHDVLFSEIKQFSKVRASHFESTNLNF